MTLASTAPIIIYSENGSTLVFAVPFQFIAAADLVVTRQNPAGQRALATFGTDYAVAGGGGATGTVTMAAAKAAGWTLEIRRFTARTQPLDLTPGDAFPAESIEGAFSRGIAIAQEIEAEIADVSARALRVPMGETLAQLPASAARANLVLGFDALGGPLLHPVTDFTGPAGPPSPVSINGLNIHTPEQFGAKGDGVTDDAAAFNAAFAALPSGGTLYLSFANYRLASGVTLNGKSNITLLSAGATITLAASITGLTVTNCTNFRACGPLVVTGPNSSTGLAASGNRDSGIADIVFKGLLVGGNFGVNATNSYGGIAVQDMTPLDRLGAFGCVTGFLVTGEYHQFNNCTIKGCTAYGARVQAGNVPFEGCQFVGNRIHAFIDGSIVANSDHSRMVGCTFNHGLACGVYLNNLQYAYLITGCVVMGSIGDGTANGQLTEEGRATSFSIYMKSTVNVVITGNMIGRSLVNIGIDGACNSLISGNTMLSDDTRTTSHIKEYGFANATYGLNAQNIYGPNVYFGNLAGGGTKRVEPLATNKSLVSFTGGSRGNTGSHVGLFDSSVSTAQVIDGTPDYVTFTSDCPAAISIAPVVTFSQQFELLYVQVAANATKDVTLTSTTSLTIMCTGVSRSGDVLTFFEAGRYVFTPFSVGANAANGQWTVTKARGGTDAATAATLLNSWTNSGGANAVAGYFKDGDGKVNLRGSLATSGASGSVAFTLPSRYRPSATLSVRLACTLAKNAYATIDSAGNVTIFYDAGATFVAFDGAAFAPS
ncbi:MAG: hypothetical protein QOH04_1533 [Sphingomonadales bacterium]|jgi:hypothetical protein|nr:hypothetical protein [Sphingomonadales bacterium]